MAYKDYNEGPSIGAGGLVMVLVVVAVLFFGLIIGLMSMVQVSAGHKGVLLEWGAVVEQRGEGLHLIMPIVQSMAIIDMRTQKFSAEADSASSDLQSVSCNIALNYHIAPGSALQIYQSVGKDYENIVISPAIQESVKASTAQFTAVELISKRIAAREMINGLLTQKLAPYGIIVESIAMENFEFSDSFNKAIEAKVTAEQNAIKEQNNLVMVGFQAQQAVTAANGQADAKLAIATAEAKAISLQGEALRNNPDIVSLRWIEKWDGQVPMIQGSGVMPIINTESMMPKEMTTNTTE